MMPLGELELRVMEAVWGQPPSTVREVADRMREDTERAYTTVMTTLDRLHKKGLLLREKDGLAWRYQQAVSRASWERQVADQLAMELLSRGEAGLAALVDASADHALLDKLAALIDARRRSS
jgi:predicted transcriptional regulator